MIFSATLNFGALVGSIIIAVFLAVCEAGEEELYCPLKYTAESFIEGDIVRLKAIHPQEPTPTLTIVQKDENQEEVESWWAYDVEEKKYKFATVIRPADPPVHIRAVCDLTYGDTYHYFVSLNHKDGIPAMESTLVPIQPTETDFNLNEKKDERKDKCVIILRTQKPDEKEGKALTAAIKQFLFMEQSGELVPFFIRIRTDKDKKRYCVLFSLVNKYKAKGFIACFLPQEEDAKQETMHHFQTIYFNTLPLLAVIQLKSPLIIAADSNTKNAYDSDTDYPVIPNIIKVWSQSEDKENDLLTNVQEIKLHIPILSIASIETEDYLGGYLAVGTISGVFIFKYDGATYKLVQHQLIEVTDVVQVIFQRLNSKQILLNILTSQPKDNIQVYVLQEYQEDWKVACKVTCPYSKFLEVSSFDFKGFKKDQLICVAADGAYVNNITGKKE